MANSKCNSVKSAVPDNLSTTTLFPFHEKSCVINETPISQGLMSVTEDWPAEPISRGRVLTTRTEVFGTVQNRAS